jgi:hypothetical protein
MLHQKQPEKVEYFNYSGSMITRCTHEIKSRIVTARAAFNKRKVLFRQQIEPKFEEKTSKVLHLDYSFIWC